MKCYPRCIASLLLATCSSVISPLVWSADDLGSAASQSFDLHLSEQEKPT